VLEKVYPFNLLHQTLAQQSTRDLVGKFLVGVRAMWICLLSVLIGTQRLSSRMQALNPGNIWSHTEWKREVICALPTVPSSLT